MERVTYSFIIPHKNTPELLQRCLDSIPYREDIQIIVVDDNSDEDKKPTINCKNVEVILLDAEHAKGAGRARNVGIEHAKGKWLLFADADDYYTEYLSILLDKYVNDDITDIVYLNAEMINEKGDKFSTKINELIKKYLNGQEYSEMHLRYGVWTPWSRMVRRDIVEKKQLEYDEIPVCNDKMFCLQCSKYAQTMTVESGIVYMYYKPTNGSQIDHMRNNKSLGALLDVRQRTISLYNHVGYNPVPSLFGLVCFSEYSKGLSFSTLVREYKESLKRSQVNFVTDLNRFLCQRLRRNT